MRNWHEFITMGGYARYVWPAYGVVLIVLAASAWSSCNGLRRILFRVRNYPLGGGEQ